MIRTTPQRYLLAENVVREALHPIDEVKAFSACVDDGCTVADIAIKFNCAESLVNQRLRLASVDDRILEAYRGGEFDMETLTRFAMTTDRTKQLSVYEGACKDPYHGLSKYAVARAMKIQSIALTSKLGHFVGLEDYVSAGGTVTEDLFAGQDDSACLLEDVELVQELANKKLEQAAKARGLEEEWRWVRLQTDFDYHDRSQYLQLQGTDYVLSETEEQEVVELECKIGILGDRNLEDWTDEDRESYHAGTERLEELEDLESSQAHYDPDDMQNAGCVVTIGRGGKVEVVRGLVRDEEAQDPEPQKSPPADVLKPLSEALKTDLQMVRTTIIKSSLAGNFNTCFDLMTFCLAKHILSDYGGSSGLNISATDTKTRTYSAEGIKDYDDWTEEEGIFESRVKALPLDILKSSAEDAFTSFCALPLPDRRAIFNTCVAMSLRQQSGEQVLWPENELTMKRLDIEFTGKFQLTDNLYWKRLSVPQILVIVEKIFGKRFAKSRQSDTKARLVELMHNAFQAWPEAAVDDSGAVQARPQLPSRRLRLENKSKINRTMDGFPEKLLSTGGGCPVNTRMPNLRWRQAVRGSSWVSNLRSTWDLE